MKRLVGLKFTTDKQAFALVDEVFSDDLGVFLLLHELDYNEILNIL